MSKDSPIGMYLKMLPGTIYVLNWSLLKKICMSREATFAFNSSHTSEFILKWKKTSLLVKVHLSYSPGRTK